MTSGLTIEELITMGYYKNPYFDYRKEFKRLKKIHNFSFNLRQKLTPQRKSAIRKIYIKNFRLLNKIDKGYYTFIPAKKSQIKNLSNQFPFTNKGIIYNKPVTEGTLRKTKIFGRGKKTKLEDIISIKDKKTSGAFGKETKKITFYLPFPDLILESQVYIDSFIEIVNDKLKPDYIAVAINGYAGTKSFLPFEMEKYAPQLSETLSNESEEATAAFTGIYIIYFKKRLNKKWLKKVKRIINSLY